MLTLVFLLSCGSKENGAQPTQDRHRDSVIFITLDTTRQDRLGCYGYEKAKTPTIDALANQGQIFNQSYATVPLTTPSHTSMFTGLYPSRHGVHSNGDAVLSEELTTVTEILDQNGYRTAGSVSAFVTTKIWGFSQGFDVFFDDIKRENDNQRWRLERNAEQVVNDLISWLEEDMSEEPFFMWAHFYDAHHPHQVPDTFEHNFLDIYDAEISYVDYHIGRLRDVAENVAGAENITWVITADHGEAFGEHKENGHGLFVWNTTMQVPLIIKPSINWISQHSDFQAGHKDSTNTVSGVDIAPTILSLVGLGNQLPNIDGIDISTTLERKELQREFVYMESTQPQVRFGYHPEIAVVGDGLKLFDTPSPHLYGLKNDILEKNNIISTTGIPKILEGKAKETFLLASEVDSQSSINNQVVDQLAALGYISNDFDQSEISNIDAKDKIATISKIELIRKLQKKSLEAKGNRAKIEEKIEFEYLNLLEKEPQIAEARIGLASLYTRQKRYVKAIEVYEAALTLQPQSSVLRLNMANVYAEMGAFKKGIELLENLLEQVPTDQQAQASLLKMNIDSKNLSRSLELGKTYLKQSPQNREMQALVGIALVRSQQFNMAHQLLMASTQDDIPRQYVYESIAKLNIARNQVDEGLTYFLKEFEFFPTADIARLIGNIYSGKKDFKNASSYYKKSIDLTKNPSVRVQYVQSLFNEQKYKEAETELAPLFSENSKNPNVLILQANIYAKTNRYDEGKKLFEKAKSLLPK